MYQAMMKKTTASSSSKLKAILVKVAQGSANKMVKCLEN